MAGQYQDYPEIMNTEQVSELLSTSKNRVFEWIRSGKIGELDGARFKIGYHFYKAGNNGGHWKFVKDRICELFGIMPDKQINKPEGENVNEECFQIVKRLMKLSPEKRQVIKTIIEWGESNDHR